MIKNFHQEKLDSSMTSRIELDRAIFVQNARDMYYECITNGARNTEYIEEVGNRSLLPFTTSRSFYSLAVLCSSDLGRYPCLPMTTSLHPHTSSSRHFAAVYRLPTAMTHFEDIHRHSRLPGDKKETERARPNTYVALASAFPYEPWLIPSNCIRSIDLRASSPNS